MSIVINMPMPDSCGSCPLYYESLYDANDEPCAVCLGAKDGKSYGCGYKEIDGIDQTKEKMPWCPIEGELPEKHGRLIDADALMNIFADRLTKVSVRYGIDSAVAGAVAGAISGAMKLLDVQPTVIEAEGE